MNWITRIQISVCAAGICLPGLVSAQSVQVLKEEWVASSFGLHKVERSADGTAEFLSAQKDDSSGLKIKAIALEDVTATGIDELTRNVIVVDESENNNPRLLRFKDGEGSGQNLPYQNASGLPDFRFITTLAVATDGETLWFNGYSKRKRQYELWKCTLTETACVGAQQIINGTPQLTESVYLDGADVPDDISDLQGGGLIGVTGREVLFFPKDIGVNDSPLVIADVRNLSSIKNNSRIQSAALARNSTHLMLALSTRDVVAVDLNGNSAVGAPLMLAPNSNVAGCEDDRSQLLRIRSLGSSGDDAVAVVTDSTCRLVHKFTLKSDADTNTVTQELEVRFSTTPDLLALSVGEGTFFRCSTPTCEFTTGVTAIFDDVIERTFWSRKINDLCDPRVNTNTTECPFTADADGRLLINPQLPQDIQDALDPKVQIYVPAHLSSASANGRFGVLFVKADPVTRETLHRAFVDIGPLSENGMPELDVALVGDPDFPTFAQSVLEVFNNDVVAYASDNPDQPSISATGNRGFEATPSVIGRQNPLERVYRGYSVMIYGLQEDLYLPTSDRVPDDGVGALDGGIASLGAGSAEVCDVTLVYGNGAEFNTADNTEPGAFFMNLAACLFSDLKTLALDTLVYDSIEIGGLSTYQQLAAAQLANLEDKLGKALSEAVPSAGPNAGDTNFGSVYSQLQNWEDLVLSTPFILSEASGQNIYQNDLLARIKVLRFTLINRTAASIGLPLEL